MNLLDAIKSGRPFRRMSWNKDILVEVAGDGSFRYLPDGGYRWPDRHELVADDWETVEPTATITLPQFWEAVEFTWGPVRDARVFEKFARKLGLEDKP